MDEIKVFAPATVANVACGFDIFGFALNTPGDIVHAKVTHGDSIVIKEISGDNGKLPKNSDKNTAAVAVKHMLRHLGSPVGIELTIHKQMPLGSGLGSSAASAVGSLYAVNLLLGRPFTNMELIPFAMQAEKVACGSAHADNVAPGLLGGFTLVRSYHPLDITSIPTQLNLYATILHPHIEISTAMARQLLPASITLQQHTQQNGNAAAFVLALCTADSALLARCLEDIIAEPARAPLIPSYEKIKTAALKHGALGCCISGSGPSLFALSLDEKSAADVGTAMLSASLKGGLGADVYISNINKEGPRVIP